jgi:uncharacterized protein (TIGR02118 family)
MTTLIVCIKRRPSLTRLEFSRYWREAHGPLVRSCTQFMRHVRSYTQFHLLEGPSPVSSMFGVDAAYDGVAVLSFSSPEAIAAAFSEPRYLEIVRPDEFNFVDLENCLSFVTNEVVVHP